MVRQPEEFRPKTGKEGAGTFHNQWQSYRTRKNPKIELETQYGYKDAGKYQVVVKVIDILGNDTTKTLEIKM